MINYDNNLETLDLDCDGVKCGKSQQFDSGSFHGAVAESKEQGWIFKNKWQEDHLEFWHYCSEKCAKS